MASMPGRSIPATSTRSSPASRPTPSSSRKSSKSPIGGKAPPKIRQLAEHFRDVPGFPGRQHHLSQLVVRGDSQGARPRPSPSSPNAMASRPTSSASPAIGTTSSSNSAAAGFSKSASSVYGTVLCSPTSRAVASACRVSARPSSSSIARKRLRRSLPFAQFDVKCPRLKRIAAGTIG